MPPPSGIAAFTSHFEKCPPPKRICSETVKQRHVRLRKEKNEKHKEELKVKTDAYEELKKKHEGDAYKTLFVARIAYDVTEKKLRREFERFGPIKNITMIKDEEGNPRGYSFIQYESEKCMRDAYKRGDGTKLNGRRVLVDVERGRTVRGWKPRKLGGGLGDTRGDKTKRSSTSGRATSSRTGTSSRGGGSDRRSSTGGGDRERRSGTGGGGEGGATETGGAAETETVAASGLVTENEPVIDGARCTALLPYLTRVGRVLHCLFFVGRDFRKTFVRRSPRCFSRATCVSKECMLSTFCCQGLYI